MATTVYKNAKLLIEGRDISAEMSELGVDYSAEMLDETAMGDDTRIHKGGLFDAALSGTGHMDFAADAPSLLFSFLGADDSVVGVWPLGITEGSTDGFMMKAAESEFRVLGGPVGSLLDFTFNFATRGIEA